MTATRAEPTSKGTTVQNYQMRIGDQWLDAADGRRFETVNPYTGQAWASVPDAGPADVDLAVQAATAAMQGEWGRCTGFERARHMRRLADILERDAEEL
jgi:aldehyde dehydrogenase (NAD+)